MVVSSSRFEASVGWRDASESPSRAGLAPRLFSRISGKRKRAGATSRHPELDQRPAASYLTRSAAFPRIGAEKSNLCQQQSEANTSKSKRRAVAAIRTRNPRSTAPPATTVPNVAAVRQGSNPFLRRYRRTAPELSYIPSGYFE